MTEEGTPFWGALDSETASTPRTNETQIGSGMPEEGTPVREKTGEDSTPKSKSVVIEAKKTEFPTNSYRRYDSQGTPYSSITFGHSHLDTLYPQTTVGLAITLAFLSLLFGPLTFLPAIYFAMKAAETINPYPDHPDAKRVKIAFGLILLVLIFWFALTVNL